MINFSPARQRKICTTIDREDHSYCKLHGLKFAHLIRAGVRDHRVHTNDPDAVESARELVISRDKAIQHRNKILEILEELLTKEQYVAFLDELNK